MTVLCMFYIELVGRKKQGRDLFELKLVRVGLQETNNFFFRPSLMNWLLQGFRFCSHFLQPLKVTTEAQVVIINGNMVLASRASGCLFGHPNP